MELASLGHQVWGIDVRRFQLTHPNFKFVQGDICNTPFKNASFQRVTAVSVLEHVGLGDYGDPKTEQGPVNAMAEIKRILCDDGKLIMSIPVGKRSVSWPPTYDLKSLRQLLSGFKIEEIAFIAKRGDFWKPAPIKQIEPLSWETDATAVALIVAQPTREIP